MSVRLFCSAFIFLLATQALANPKLVEVGNHLIIAVSELDRLIFTQGPSHWLSVIDKIERLNDDKNKILDGHDATMAGQVGHKDFASLADDYSQRGEQFKTELEQLIAGLAEAIQFYSVINPTNQIERRVRSLAWAAAALTDSSEQAPFQASPTYYEETARLLIAPALMRMSLPRSQNEVKTFMQQSRAQFNALLKRRNDSALSNWPALFDRFYAEATKFKCTVSFPN